MNEYTSRTIAGLTFGIAVLTIAADQPWLIVALVYLFVGGVLAGPKLTPTGYVAVKLIVPKLIKKKQLVAGPPKQFAQAVGLVLMALAFVLAYPLGLTGAAYVTVGVLALFSGLEAFVGFCMGCFVFGYLMRFGVIPEELCQRCADLNFGPALQRQRS